MWLVTKAFSDVWLKSLNSNYTAWQFSGQILFKWKINKDFRNLPSVSDRNSSCLLLVSQQQKENERLYSFTAYKAWCLSLWDAFVACPTWPVLWPYAKFSPSPSASLASSDSLSSSLHTFPIALHFQSWPADGQCCQSYLYKHHRSVSASNLLETGYKSLMVCESLQNKNINSLVLKFAVSLFLYWILINWIRSRSKWG